MLALLGNFVWIITSWYIPLMYLIGGVLFFPLLPFLWPVIKFSFLPFGRELVSKSYLEQFKQVESTAQFVEESRFSSEKSFGDTGKKVRFLANVVWLLSFGWMLAIMHILAAVLSIFLFWTIIAIPNIGAHLRIIPIAFRPF